jgi:hypothetical protein
MLQPLNPSGPVRSELGSSGEVSGEVDQVRALQEEVVEVRLHQGQGFISAFFFFGSFRMLFRF